MAESINLSKVIAASAAITTNQVADDPETNCPPGYVQRIKSFSWQRIDDGTGTITVGGAGVQLELKIGSRTLVDLQNFTSGMAGEGAAVVTAAPVRPVKGLIPLDDLFYPGEQLAVFADTPANNPSILTILMERVSIQELQAEAKGR